MMRPKQRRGDAESDDTNDNDDDANDDDKDGVNLL